MNKQQIAEQIKKRIQPYIDGHYACADNLDKLSMREAFRICANLIDGWAMDRCRHERMYTKRDMDAIDKDRKKWQKEYNEIAKLIWFKEVKEDGNPKEDGTYIVVMDGDIIGEEEPFVTMCGYYDGKWDEGRVYLWRELPPVPEWFAEQWRA